MKHAKFTPQRLRDGERVRALAPESMSVFGNICTREVLVGRGIPSREGKTNQCPVPRVPALI